jgi:hypothetical protein
MPNGDFRVLLAGGGTEGKDLKHNANYVRNWLPLTLASW